MSVFLPIRCHTRIGLVSNNAHSALTAILMHSCVLHFSYIFQESISFLACHQPIEWIQWANHEANHHDILENVLIFGMPNVILEMQLSYCGDVEIRCIMIIMNAWMNTCTTTNTICCSACWYRCLLTSLLIIPSTLDPFLRAMFLQSDTQSVYFPQNDSSSWFYFQGILGENDCFVKCLCIFRACWAQR